MIVMDIEQRRNWRLKRIDKEITITEIAKHLGCAHSLISMWESGGKMSEDKVQDYIRYIEEHPGKVSSIKMIIRSRGNENLIS
jgi:DNA-binding transcriptional regulator YiaG